MVTLWAKWGASGGGFYPLEAHLIDTAAFARVLIDRWLPPRVLAVAAERCGVEPASVADVLVSAAAFHDLGKATSVFQTQQLAGRRPAGIDQHQQGLIDGSLACPSLGTHSHDDAKRWVRRHEVASATILHGRLLDAGATGLAALVAGHHGRWDIPDVDDPFDSACRYYDWALTDPRWVEVRGAIQATVEGATGASPDRGLDDPAVVPVLTGVVVLADWLASDLADRDPVWPDHGDWSGHHRERLVEAERTVDEFLGTASRPPGDFADVFGFSPSRPVQEHLVRRDRPPAMRVATVPTGDGKTEAALGHWLLNGGERQGLFFALPTMATSDAMMRRVRAMFADADATYGSLAHGRAVLNEFYSDAPRDVVGIVDQDEIGGLAPSRWLAGNRRAVLAPVAVGTADQVVLAAVKHRFNFLRMLGLVGKTVVLDEVHSYDPYMAHLLERFLRWAGEWRVDVVLLSASLPTERLEAYVAAYTGGAATPSPSYPSVTTATPTGEVDVAALEASGAKRTVALRHHVIDDPVSGTVELVRDLRAAHPDAKIGVIVNTVARCQAIAAELDGRGAATRIGGDLHVMHSRFTAGRRAEQVDEVVATYGKGSTGGAATMVATQVVEQSVDLDFDVLVTDLCPAPSLIQRMGRLHRHDLTAPDRDRARPDGLTAPLVHVVVPAAVQSLDATRFSFLPYPAASVLRTWTDGLDGGRRASLTVPDDVQAVVDASHVTYVEVATAEDEHVIDELVDRLTQRSHADQRRIPAPEDMRTGRVGRGLGDYTDGSDQILTRWIDGASFHLLLVNGDGGTWTGPAPRRPDRVQARELLAHVVTVPFDPTPDGDEVAAEAGATPEGWSGTVLDGVRIVDLSRTPALYLDPLLGLTRRTQDD